ncbi:MAG: S53 family peptidase [Fimbriimonadaceae bacterium]
MKAAIFNRHFSNGGVRKLGALLALGASATCFGQAQQLSTLGVDMPSTIFRAIGLGATDPSKVLHVAVSLEPRDSIAMQNYADNVSNPKSPYYRQFLTPVQFGQKFGATLANVNRVVNYLKAQGFSITLVADSHLAILADCTVGQAQAAFHTEIGNYHALEPSKGERADFYSFNLPLEVPTSIAPTILDVSGLQNAAKPVARSRRGAKVAKLRGGQGQAGQTLTPSQARVLYNLAPIYNIGDTGNGRNIAISNFDGFRLTNVPLFYSQFGLATPPGGVGSNITTIVVDGGRGAGAPQGEGDLDIQMVLGEAPLCNLLIYDGGGPLVDVLTREAQDNLADIVTESYGWSLSASDATACHNVHLQMTTQGITYMEATGDNGTTLEPFAYSNYEPEVFQVGGSIATVGASGVRQAEVGWSGSGGGWATDAVPFNVLPPWQKGKNVPTNINFRLNPDVAIHADGVLNGQDASAYYIYFNGQLVAFAGTSCASPTFAGALGDAEQRLIGLNELPVNTSGKRRLGRISDLVYQQNGRSDVWHDITSGSNGTLPNGQTSNAGLYWDFVTGFGAINWAQFVATFGGSTNGNTVIPTSVGIYAGQGANATGGVAQLAAVDKSYYTQAAVVNFSQGVVSAAIMKYTLTTNVSSLSSLTLNVVADGPFGTTNFIYVYNYSKSAFDLINTSPNTSVDTTYTLALPNIANYVGPGNTVQVIDRMVYPLRRGLVPYTMRLDLATLSEGM